MTADEQNYSAQKSPMENALVALCAAGTVLIISWLIRYSAYGIDFTDESYYLVWIANPFIYDWSINQFGFVYHPFYWLLGGDIAALRQANILITFALAWGLAYSFLASLAVGLKEGRITLTVVSASLATSGFILFDSWLPTPSYNSLNLQALLIAATGLVLAEKNADRKSIIGWLLIGVGGWLAFMAKPSTALALAVGVFIYFLFARKLSIRLLALAMTSALALLLFSALLIEGSVLGFINRIKLGVEFAEYLGGGHTLSQILRIDNFELSEKLKLAILLVAVPIFLALCSMCAKNKKWQVIGLLISIAFFSITALFTLGQIHRAAGLGQFQGLLIFAVVYAAVIAALALCRLQTLKSVSSQQWMIAALFMAMPHIYAFGTNGNYWQAGSSAAIFWLLAGLTLLGPMIRECASWMLLVPVALAAQTVTATLIQTGLEHPYRQPQPLRLNASNLEIGPQGSALTLSEDYSAYISSAMDAAKTAGFEPNTPLIDLSGQSPGILYAVGAEPIGQAWTIGGYPGSLKLAKAALARTSCEKIAASWILFEQDGPLSIPTELMYSLGADFPYTYERVGTWQTAAGAGGYPDYRTQDLYRPLEQHKTLMHCQKLRKEAEQ
jgi:hypothetical protein